MFHPGIRPSSTASRVLGLCVQAIWITRVQHLVHASQCSNLTNDRRIREPSQNRRSGIVLR